MTRAIAIALLLAACAGPVGGPAPEQTLITRYCAATTPALRAALRWQMGLAPDVEMLCD